MEFKQVHLKEKAQKKMTNLVTYKKIKKFSQKYINFPFMLFIYFRPYIMNILSKYRDPKKTPEYAQKFKAFLQERVSLEKALRELTLRNYFVFNNNNNFFRRERSCSGKSNCMC